MTTLSPPTEGGAGYSAADTHNPLLANAPHRVGKVTLTVRDLERVSDFYQRAVGLVAIEREPGIVRLGTGSSILIELRRDTDAPPSSRANAGLFHTAFLLPSRSDLGAWLTFAVDEQFSLLGASDHLVSEAVYLADPEGNGIEIYADRPSDEWRRSNGLIVMATEPLDLGRLMAAAGDGSWSGFPPAGIIGHVHLKVGDIAAADAFYADLLGFEVTSRYPGASFFGSGGYHHQLAANIWSSRGAPKRPERTSGLSDIEIRMDVAALDALRAKLPRDRLAHVDATSVSLQDPWGTAITLRSS